MQQLRNKSDELPIVSQYGDLLKRGICKVKLPETLDAERCRWADELSQVTPLMLGFEGDGEYAFYRNILDEPEFPFDAILGNTNTGGLSEIGKAILRHFPILPGTIEPAPTTPSTVSPDTDLCGILSQEIRLDDAFCVHYNMNQDDTSGAKHVDPSDITINMCLQKSGDARGSYVLFHGTKQLESQEFQEFKRRTEGVEKSEPGSAAGSIRVHKVSAKDIGTTNRNNNNADDDNLRAPFAVPTPPPREERFLVPQVPGYAIIHFGDHPHETTPLRRGNRTNVVLTYLYTDSTRSDAATRSCY